MGLSNILKEQFDVTVNKSRGEIFETISKGKQSYHWTDLLQATINYKTIRIADEKLEIKRASYGRITISIKDTEEGKSKLTCEVRPFNTLMAIATAFVIGILILWTAVTLFAARNQAGLFMITAVWILFPLIMFLSYKYTMWVLIEYTKRVIHDISAGSTVVR
jgi:hypothetical protein